MERQDKEQFVAQMNERLAEVAGIFLADFRGVSVNDSKALRNKLREAGVEMKVVKNRIFKLALKGTAFDGLIDDLLVGPNAVLIANDIVAGAKALRDFLKERDGFPLQVKGGALPQQRLSADDVSALASLPSREQLIAQFMGMLQAPLRDFAALLNAPLRDFAAVVKALENKKSAEN